MYWEVPNNLTLLYTVCIHFIIYNSLSTNMSILRCVAKRIYLHFDIYVIMWFILMLLVSSFVIFLLIKSKRKICQVGGLFVYSGGMSRRSISSEWVGGSSRRNYSTTRDMVSRYKRTLNFHQTWKAILLDLDII